MTATRVGYTGGDAPDPTYDSVCDDDGHTEAVRVTFDSTVVAYDDILREFWRLSGSRAHAKTESAVQIRALGRRRIPALGRRGVRREHRRRDGTRGGDGDIVGEGVVRRGGETPGLRRETPRRETRQSQKTRSDGSTIGPNAGRDEVTRRRRGLRDAVEKK